MKKIFLIPSIATLRLQVCDILTKSGGGELNNEGNPAPPDTECDAPSRLVEALNPHAEKPNALPH